MKQLLIRFWQWLGRVLGIESGPPPSAGTADSTATAQTPSATTPTPPAPPVTLPPPLPAQFDIHAGEAARYTVKPSVLTWSERQFYDALKSAVGSRYHILAKVRLWDIIRLENEPPERKQHINRLSCRHVDFLLCEPSTLRPLLGIELDDKSHERPEAYSDDKYKDELFKAAGLELRRIQKQTHYSSRTLREQIAAAFDPPA